MNSFPSVKVGIALDRKNQLTGVQIFPNVTLNIDTRITPGFKFPNFTDTGRHSESKISYLDQNQIAFYLLLLTPLITLACVAIYAYSIIPRPTYRVSSVADSYEMEPLHFYNDKPSVIDIIEPVDPTLEGEFKPGATTENSKSLFVRNKGQLLIKPHLEIETHFENDLDQLNTDKLTILDTFIKLDESNDSNYIYQVGDDELAFSAGFLQPVDEYGWDADQRHPAVHAKAAGGGLIFSASYMPLTDELYLVNDSGSYRKDYTFEVSYKDDLLRSRNYYLSQDQNFSEESSFHFFKSENVLKVNNDLNIWGKLGKLTQSNLWETNRIIGFDVGGTYRPFDSEAVALSAGFSSASPTSDALEHVRNSLIGMEGMGRDRGSTQYPFYRYEVYEFDQEFENMQRFTIGAGTKFLDSTTMGIFYHYLVDGVDYHNTNQRSFSEDQQSSSNSVQQAQLFLSFSPFRNMNINSNLKFHTVGSSSVDDEVYSSIEIRYRWK